MPFDLDDIFAFETFKVVRVRHRVLGIIHKILWVLVVLYYVLYVMIYQQKYMKHDSPVGFVTANALPSGDETNNVRNPVSPDPTLNFMDNKPYCRQSGNACERPKCLPCANFTSGNRVTSTTGEGIVLFSRLKVKRGLLEKPSELETVRVEAEKTKDCTGTQQCPEDCKCPEERLFAAGIESYTLRVEVSVQDAQKSLGKVAIKEKPRMYKGTSCPEKGHCHDKGTEVKDALDSGLFQDGYDVFSVASLLKALDYTLDEPLDKIFPGNPAACAERPVDGKCPDGKHLTGRYEGLVIQVDLHFDGSVEEYEYRIFANTPGYATFQYVEQPDTFVDYKIQGILIRFQYTGVLKYFDLQNLIVQLVSGLVLLGYTKVAVEILMTKLLPNKGKYNLFKYEMTPDFKTADPNEKHHYEYVLARRTLEEARTMGRTEVTWVPEKNEAAQNGGKAKNSLTDAVQYLAEVEEVEKERLESLRLGHSESTRASERSARAKENEMQAPTGAEQA